MTTKCTTCGKQIPKGKYHIPGGSTEVIDFSAPCIEAIYPPHEMRVIRIFDSITSHTTRR